MLIRRLKTNRLFSGKTRLYCLLSCSTYPRKRLTHKEETTPGTYPPHRPDGRRIRRRIPPSGADCPPSGARCASRRRLAGIQNVAQPPSGDARIARAARLAAARHRRGARSDSRSGLQQRRAPGEFARFPRVLRVQNAPPAANRRGNQKSRIEAAFRKHNDPFHSSVGVCPGDLPDRPFFCADGAPPCAPPDNEQILTIRVKKIRLFSGKTRIYCLSLLKIP